MFIPFAPRIREASDRGRTEPIDAIMVTLGHCVQIDGCRYEVVEVRYRGDEITLTLARGEETLRALTINADARVTVYV